MPVDTPTLTNAQLKQFRKTVIVYYKKHGRHNMLWRINPKPYYVFVSEVMLQQTQVSRVEPKFNDFVRRFPDIVSLARSSLADVLAEWSGLGYNRRAKFIWQAAQQIVHQHNGHVPADFNALVALPGVGKNTAGAILTYAFNRPVAFVETNIRSVFMHHFFRGTAEVAESDIIGLVAATLPRQNPREWYLALMDYGTHVKATHGTYLRQLKQHKVQSVFVGSRRQIRGRVVRELIGNKLTAHDLQRRIPDERLPQVVELLVSEGIVVRRGNLLQLTV